MAWAATDTGLTIAVRHFPPGTGKWNKIEHRLFSHITLNWRGQPLTSYEIVVNLIAGPRTKNGLSVQAEYDDQDYPLGLTVSKAEMESLPIEPDAFQGKWNYTIRPQANVQVIC
jgi:hypothetical protein